MGSALHRLRAGCSAQGNLLDDTELIGVLASTKATTGEVNERLAGASEAKRRISDACEEYRPVAHRAQLLYFLIAQFSTVNCMYQTSLAQARTTQPGRRPGHLVAKQDCVRVPVASACVTLLEHSAPARLHRPQAYMSAHAHSRTRSVMLI